MSSSQSSPIVPLVLAALTAGAVAFGIHQLGSGSRLTQTGASAVPVKAQWTATAPGRVEPRGGEVNLAAQSAGRIIEVLARGSDKVHAGDLLARIDDGDAIARMLAADAEASVRKRERDTETGATRLALDRRKAEDRLNETERAIATARLALDRLQIDRRAKPASVTDEQLTSARNTLESAVARLEPDRLALRQAQLADGVPLATRLEAGLTAARSDLSLAEAALERTRVRAPFDGTILQAHARIGETVAGTPEQPLFVIGDLSQLRVRAEVEERDVTKVRVGQAVLLKSDAFGDREFAGTVVSIADGLRPPKLAQRGPRRPSDIDTLEVMIEVAPGSPLMPGMRTDVFFKVDPVAEPPRADAARSSPVVARAATATAPVGEGAPQPTR